jgi:NADH-quinone oxidoreductase subunit L
MDAHQFAKYGSIALCFLGIGVAYVLHLAGRTSAAAAKADAIRLGFVQEAAQHKWYVDELYHAVIVKPVWVLAHVFHMIDKLLVDGLVNLFGWLPRGLGGALRRTQSGLMHDYALRMAGGVAVIVLLLWFLRSGPGLSDALEISAVTNIIDAATEGTR